ncbi:MAG: gliding motility-associated C-terminal domain-containing protein, partial [Bacteroidota bacterium]
ADTLYINVLEPPAPDGDTLHVVVPVGGMDTVCLSIEELFGTAEFLTNFCQSFTGNAQVNSTGVPCVEVVGVEVGYDQACIEICDNLGICDTTWILIEVVDTSTAIEIFNGFSPNEDGVNDFFKIKNIELYPENELVIFNRWGNRVFHRKGYTNADPWKGIYKNTWLPDETYFYVLDVNLKGRWAKYSGMVELRK